jgi:uncharacterized protein YndB with AHSA1/START domain
VNATLWTEQGRQVLRFERRFAHPVEKVWRAITDPAELPGWFPARMEMDFRPGGTIHFVHEDGNGPEQDGVITELEPPRVFAYTWGPSALRWELQPDGDGCRLLFTHTFDDRPSAATFAAGWEICLATLRSIVDGEPPAADPSRWPELHETYVERFGLGEGTARRTADGWEIRFDRQLTKPVDDTWAALTGSSAAVVAGAPAPARAGTEASPTGAVTAVTPPSLLEVEWLDGDRPAGRVRWELAAGNGGARLALTQTVPAALADRLPAALAAWHAHLEALADELAGRPDRASDGRLEELTKQYAETVP